jgi:site-specific DNA-adenine methylase
MFTYYGTKKKLSKSYPKPSFDTIIEPFAGAAMYSLFDNYWEKNVILNDKYDKVFNIWNYLINQASISDIKNLPNLTTGLKLDDLNVSDVEKTLLGFYANPSSAVPKKTVSKRGEISWERHKQFLIDNLHKVKHWKICNVSYDELENIEGTWYIDPPYKFGGEYYHSSASNKHLDYDKLAEWCLNRNGEIIVCENDKADWLSFKPLVELNGQLHKTMEVIYYQYNK